MSSIVGLTIYIVADTIAVGIADAGAGGWRAGAVTVAVHHIVDGGVIAIVAGVADEYRKAGAVVIGRRSEVVDAQLSFTGGPVEGSPTCQLLPYLL